MHRLLSPPISSDEFEFQTLVKIFVKVCIVIQDRKRVPGNWKVLVKVQSNVI